MREYGKVWESMKVHESVWESMKVYEKVWKCMKVYERVCESMRVYEKECYGRKSSVSSIFLVEGWGGVSKYNNAAVKNDDWKVQINVHLEDKKYIRVLCVREKKIQKRTKNVLAINKYN